MRHLRRLSVFGRVAVALGLLGALWVTTVVAIDRATDRAEEQRVQDRLLLAKVAVRPVTAWLDAARDEAGALAAALGPNPQRGPIDAYLRGPHAFGRSVLVMDGRSVVVAASSDRQGALYRPATACVEVDEKGVAEPDAVFVGLVRDAAGTISAALPVPGICDANNPAVAVAVRTAGGGTLVLFATMDDLRARLSEAGAFVPDLSVILVTPGGNTLSSAQGVPAPPRPGLADLVGDRTRPAAARHRTGDAQYVGAFQPARAGWGVVVDQPADAFDATPTSRPAVLTAFLLTAVFALALAVVAWFDIRGRRAARRADEHRQAFLSIVGHELRTPLTVIKGYTDTLATRWDALDDRSRQMLVESMAPQAQRQARVIEHLLTAAALQAGSYARPDVGPVELAPVLDQVADEFRFLAPLHSFEVDIETGAEGVEGDAAALGQVLGELVDNAVKYSPSGGLVRIVASRAGRSVEIAVEDDGVGLPSDTERLFDPFVQGESVDRRVHDEGGVGVGLYIARSLVETMGGRVRAERRPDGGSRFVLTLDRARVVTRAPQRQAP